MLSLWVYPNSWADVLALIDQLLFSLYLFLYSFAHSSILAFKVFTTIGLLQRTGPPPRRTVPISAGFIPLQSLV